MATMNLTLQEAQRISKEQGYRLIKYSGTHYFALVSDGSGRYVYGGRGYNLPDIAEFLAIPVVHR